MEPKTREEIEASTWFKNGAEGRRSGKKLTDLVRPLRLGCWQYDAVVAGYDSVQKHGKTMASSGPNERTKPLQFFNGRGWCTENGNDMRWKNRAMQDAPHAYVAAYSREDARRVIAEYCGQMPSAGELKNFFSPHWGNPMEGAEPVRGLWLQFERFGKPVQVWPAPSPELAARAAGWDQDKDRIFRVVDGKMQEAGSWDEAVALDAPAEPELPRLKVLQSAAGYYIGTLDDEGFPGSRESVEYWTKKEDASTALKDGTWRPRERESAFVSQDDLKKAIAFAMETASISTAAGRSVTPEM